MIELKGGIDTIQIELCGYFKDELKDIKSILDDKTLYTENNNTRIVMRANNELSTVDEVVACLELLMQKIECKEWKVVRVDMSIDYLEKLEDNLNLSRLFLECLAIKRRKEKAEIFNTKKGIEKQGNLKISSKRTETTIYNCTDKSRLANMRVENKVKDIRNELKDREVIQAEVKKFLEEIQGLELLVEKVEDKYIDGLANLYYETIEKKYRTFSEFVAFADGQGYILTTNVLKGLMKKVGLKTSYKNFVDVFKRNRKETLNFVSKTEMKSFVSGMKRELKKSI